MPCRAQQTVPVAIAMVVLGHAGCSTKPAARLPPDADVPRTVESAVHLLRTGWLSEPDQDWILRNPKGYVTSSLHLPFGTRVRNGFGLWGGNPELLESCGVFHPEDCSAVIFGRLWEAVREDADPALVLQLDCQFRLIESIRVSHRGFYKLRVGEILERLQDQIDEHLAALQPEAFPGCGLALTLRPSGEPDLQCWSRAEFSEDGRDPVPLGELLGWISWRNGFRILHAPPYIELPFHERCSWPEIPAQFQPVPR